MCILPSPCTHIPQFLHGRCQEWRWGYPWTCPSPNWQTAFQNNHLINCHPNQYWLCVLTVGWFVLWSLIISFVWVLWGSKCSCVSPRWFVFASTSYLEIQTSWVLWGLSDFLGHRNSDHKPWWVMTCYRSLGEVLVFTFTQWKVSHRCRPSI